MSENRQIESANAIILVVKKSGHGRSRYKWLLFADREDAEAKFETVVGAEKMLLVREDERSCWTAVVAQATGYHVTASGLDRLASERAKYALPKDIYTDPTESNYIIIPGETP